MRVGVGEGESGRRGDGEMGWLSQIPLPGGARGGFKGKAQAAGHRAWCMEHRAQSTEHRAQGPEHGDLRYEI